MDQNYTFYNQVYYPPNPAMVYMPGVSQYPLPDDYSVLPNTVFQYQTAAPHQLPVVVSHEHYPMMNFPVDYPHTPGETTPAQYSGPEISNLSGTRDSSVVEQDDLGVNQPPLNLNQRDRGRGRGNWSGRGRSWRSSNDRESTGSSRDTLRENSSNYPDNPNQESATKEPRSKLPTTDQNQNRSYQNKRNNSRYQNSRPNGPRGQRNWQERNTEREADENSHDNEIDRSNHPKFDDRPFRSNDRNGQRAKTDGRGRVSGNYNNHGNHGNRCDRYEKGRQNYNNHGNRYDRFEKGRQSESDLNSFKKPPRSVNVRDQQGQSTWSKDIPDGMANLTDEEKEQLGTGIEDVLMTGGTSQAEKGHSDLVDKISGLIGSRNQGKSGPVGRRDPDYRKDAGKRPDRSDRENMRQPPKGRDGPTPRNGSNSRQFTQKKKEVPSSASPVETQRDSLIEQLHNSDYECMVCCSNVRCEVAIWSCNNCYHIFHLFCIKKWARSPAAVIEVGGGWRCPGCQNVTERVPNQYRCFCGKQLDPSWDRYETPHSCGEVCGKQRNENCPHPCNILCHPGPCPPCEATVNKTCECGKTKQFIKCAQSSKFRCDKVCEKELNCTKHQCQAVCHKGTCAICEDTFQQACYGDHTSRTVTCGTEESLYTSFTCDDPCNKQLDCGEHVCEVPCHDGPCKPCPLQPSLVTHCPCGQTELPTLTDIPRETCLDPIPVCDNKCGKQLLCGPVENAHICERECHEGECGACEGSSSRICRCGRLEKDLSCTEATQYTADNPLKCDRRCSKKKHCGRHKCNQPCCVEVDHVCDQICGRKLDCGLHKCDIPCHRGNCQSCLQASFDELTCYCGTEVLYPPVPCGTRPPECHKICTRIHPCSHPVRHTCNPDGECPPCTVLTQKQCMGKHELRKNIPCYREDISCGMPCNADLPCGLHKCKKVCHKGPCLEEGEACTQQCVLARPECGHCCGAPCHRGSTCPRTACRTLIDRKCKCGNRTARVKCLSGGVNGPDIADYQRVATANLASSLSGLQTGQTVDITELAALRAGQRQLECDKECAVMERNKRVALALEIRNPDLSAKLSGNPGYSPFLKDFAKQNPQHVSGVEKALTDLVQTAKQSKQPFRRHPFPPMNMNQRRLIHELAEFYGCETESYDSEPKKNVVVTAHKDRCWLPSVTLTSLVQRELLPKAPMPIPHSHNESDLRDAVRGMKLSTDVYVEPKRQDKKPNISVVDYFDVTD